MHRRPVRDEATSLSTHQCERQTNRGSLLYRTGTRTGIWWAEKDIVEVRVTKNRLQPAPIFVVGLSRQPCLLSDYVPEKLHWMCSIVFNLITSAR